MEEWQQKHFEFDFKIQFWWINGAMQLALAHFQILFRSSLSFLFRSNMHLFFIGHIIPFILG